MLCVLPHVVFVAYRTLPLLPIAHCHCCLPHLCLWLQGMRADAPNVKDFKGKPQLELLRGISGAFRPGVLTCLMGVSGAGKTTLMDVLAGRKTSEPTLLGLGDKGVGCNLFHGV